VANTLERDIFLVVNTNVLFSFFGKDEVVRKAKIRDEDLECRT